VKELGFIVLSYLVGSLVFGYLFALMKRRRDFGSRDLPGGAGTIRQLGWGLGVWAGILDVAKAALVAWLGGLFGLPPIVIAAGCLAVMVGHNWPVYFRFKGGMGLSSVVGSMALLMPVSLGWSVLAGVTIALMAQVTRLYRLFGLGNGIPVGGTIALVALIVFSFVMGETEAYRYLAIAFFVVSSVRSVQDVFFSQKQRDGQGRS
jgi:glycerol-3-phosphate acyltransferase PlsY